MYVKRADVYYRETVACAEWVDAMLSLANAAHRFLLDHGYFSTSVSALSSSFATPQSIDPIRLPNCQIQPDRLTGADRLYAG